MKYKEIVNQHYTKEAKNTGLSKLSTMRDVFIRNLETECILKILDKHKKNKVSILDAGCGNGYTLSSISKKFKNFKLTGFEKNNELFSLSIKRKSKKITFHNMDILSLNKDFIKKFNVIIVQRVLINLLNKKDQFKALKNLRKYLKNNGYIIFIECFNEGLKNLNNLRKKFNLKAIKPAYHNRYLDKNFFKNQKLTLIKSKIADQINNKFSNHFLISRVIDSVIIGRGKFKRNSKFVNVFDNVILEVNLDYSHLKIIVLKKKAHVFK